MMNYEYRIMEDFVESLPPGRAQQELSSAIRGRGVFRRFKSGVYYHHLEQQWYDYRDQAYQEIAIRWCQDQEFEYMKET